MKILKRLATWGEIFLLIYILLSLQEIDTRLIQVENPDYRLIIERDKCEAFGGIPVESFANEDDLFVICAFKK